MSIFKFRQSYFVQECLGPDVPATYLINLNPKLYCLRLLDSNGETLEFSARMAFPQIQKITIPLQGNYKKLKLWPYLFFVQSRLGFSGEDRVANGRLFLPPEIRQEENMKYPMVIHV